MLDDTFTPHGKHLIAGDWATGAGTFRSDPASGPAHDFAIGTPELVDRACEAAEDAFWSYGWTSRADRAAFLKRNAGINQIFTADNRLSFNDVNAAVTAVD